VYIRFNTYRRDEDSGRRQGVFQAAYRLLDGGDLARDEWKAIRAALDWFKQHLPAPKDIDPRAIFWFDATAGESTRHVWALVNLLREHGIESEMIRTDEPGEVVYRDAYQVGAIPSKRTPK